MPPKPLEQKDSLNLSFKKATSGDVGAYLELEQAVVSAVTDKTYIGVRTIAEAQEQFDENTIYLVRSGEQVVGSIQYEIKTPEHARISGVVVHPELRGKGISTKMMEFITKELCNYKKITLETHPENVAMTRLAESFRFVKGEIVPDFNGDGPRVVFQK